MFRQFAGLALLLSIAVVACLAGCAQQAEPETLNVTYYYLPG